MNKRILSVFLTICMVVGLFPSLVNAEDITIVIPPFIDQPETPVSEIIKRMEEDIPKVPDGVVTPYGTEGNITLLEKSELFINTPNGLTGTYKLSDSLRFTAALGLDLSGLKFVQSVGFDPTGCGKKDCIAVMGFKPNADNSNGALHVFIYNLESKRLLKTYVIDDGYMGWVATKLDTVDANNFFSITAGDYNGDGRDSLVIYDGIFRGSGDLGLKEIVFDGTNWKDPVNVSVTRSRNELFNPTYMKSSLKSSWDPGNKLQVAMKSGDLNKDGIDELIIVSGAGDIAKDYLNADSTLYLASTPTLAVATGQKGTSGIGELKVQNQGIAIMGENDCTITASNVAIGDIDGDGVMEIVVAGFLAETSSSDSIQFEKGSLGYSIYRFTDKFYWFSSNNGARLKGANVSAISSGDSLRDNETAWQQLSVEIAHFDGINSNPYVFINGYVYQSRFVAGGYVLERVSSSTSMDQTDSKKQNDQNFAFNFLVTSCNGTDVNEVFILDAAVGNFYGSNSGKESIEMVVGFKTDKNSQYYFRKVSMRKDDSGSWKLEVNPYYLNVASEATAGYTFAAVDVDDDSIIARYNSTQAAYTDPNVVAFLQAAPYYSDLGAGNSSTVYSYSESYTQSTTSGSEFSYGLGISAEFSTPAIKTEVSTTISGSISNAFTESLTTEYTTSFEANDHNQVIVRRTLVYLYCYDILTGTDINGKPVYETCGLVMSVPQYPVLTSLSMEQYDEFAAAYNAKYGAGVEGYSSYYLDVMGKNDGALLKKYYLNNEGNPFSYASDVSAYSNGFHMSKGDVWMELSHSGGTSQLAYSTSIGTERSKTASDSVSVNMSLSVGGSFAGFGASVGVSTSLSSLRSRGVSEAKVTTTLTSGSVQNLQSNQTDYRFSWQLIGWKTDPGDGLFKDVPFVGYAVKGTAAPPPCVNDLQYAATDEAGKVRLFWSKPEEKEGRTAIDQYYIYRTDQGKREYVGWTDADVTEYMVTFNPPSAMYIVVTQGTNRLSGIDSNEILVISTVSEEQVKKMIDEASAKLEASIAALKTAIEEGQSEAIAQAIAEVTAAYKEADALLKADLEADLSELKAKMKDADDALKVAIDQVQANLDQAVEDLTRLILEGDQASAEELKKAITELSNAYKTADDLIKADLSTLSEKVAKLDETLSAVDAALQRSIERVQTNLDQAIEYLTRMIESGDQNSADNLQKAVSELTEAYGAADAVLQLDFSDRLAASEKEAGANLQAAVAAAQTKLNEAIEALQKAIADGDAANSAELKAAVETLTKAYEAADAALQKNLDEVQSTLEQEIEALRTELQSLREQMNTGKQETDESIQTMAAVNSTQQTELNTSKGLATAGLCLSGVSLLGNIALLIAYLQKKRKQ